MKNLLFISIYPFPLDMGSKQHAHYFLKALTAQFNVHCLFFMPPGMMAPSVSELATNGFDPDKTSISFFQDIPRQNNYLQFFYRTFAYPNNYTNSASHRHGLECIRTIIREQAIDIVHFEHFWIAKYALWLNGTVKKTMVYHDLHHDVFRQQIRFVSSISQKLSLFAEFLKSFAFEWQLEKHLALKVFLNPDEMRVWPKRAVHVPHIVNSEIEYRPVRRTDFFNLLFLGAYSHPPNRLSVKFIIERILPELARLQPNFCMHIVGSGTEKFAGLLTDPVSRAHVKLHGFQKDINAVFKDMDLALFPIDYGGGVKTKILDALAAGVPVVTTPSGVTGMPRLPENSIGVGRNAEELVRELRDLMQSVSLRDQRARAGKCFIEAEHSFATFSRGIFEAFDAL